MNTSFAADNSGKYPEAKAIKNKIAFSALLKADGYAIEKAGQSFRCHCPFHDEHTPSFSTYRSDRYAHCFGCGWSGDIIDYQCKKGGMGYADAIAALEARATTLGSPPPVLSSVCTTSQQDQLRVLSEEERQVIKGAQQRLQESPDLWKSIASKRKGWKPETIKQLAFDGSLAYPGALGFVYSTGLKYRDWPNRTFGWEFGNGSSLWREHLLTDAVSRVYLTEGETDAIALVNAGFENETGVIVLALASATALPIRSLELLRDKHVVLLMDDDPAGERARETVGARLACIAADIQTLSWEVTHEGRR